MNFIIRAFLLMLPAYVSSPGAVLSRGKRPIDMGKNFFDGKRILGDGKTFEGLALGTLLGFVAGIIVEVCTKENLYGSFLNIFFLSFGGLLGDMCNSFLKRRLNVERGGKLPVLDQLNLVFGSWMLCFLFDRNWFFESFNWYIAITVLVMTPLLHRAANIAAYKLGLKDVPW
ncbi:MAG: CDP-2,3-bis-(O-geranylgeranyl)-sn-glycerol synthase [Candidatus Thermoplasmatota archaeon]|nr:CDP-2,3-bis-(O-geranylgeranyl)-sn-glycerol synthase [Candidatus Thermoplasmatota archaeon]